MSSEAAGVRERAPGGAQGVSELERRREELLHRARCIDHPERPAVSRCSDCGSFLCSACNERGAEGFETYCSACKVPEPSAEPLPVEVPAPFLPRMVAHVLDAILIRTILDALHYLLGWTPEHLQQPGSTIFNAALVLGLGVWLFYHTFCWARFGATPGKALLGLRVRHASGAGRLSWSAAVLRWLSYLVSMMPFALGFLAIIWDPEKRGWHDRLAGSRVVRILR